MKIHGLGAGTRFNVLAFALSLLVVLWGCHCTPPPSDMHFLCLNFTVEATSRPGESWLTVQCSMDGMPLLEYDNANKAKALGSLGKEVNSTKAWTDLTQTLEEMGQEFRKRLLHTKPRPVNTKGHPTLQVNMRCQNERGQNTGASLLFSMNKQNSILFDAKKVTWTEINPEARGDKEEWENDKELESDLRKFSTGDCNNWLNKFLNHSTDIPRPTVKTSVVIRPTPDYPNKEGVILVVIITILIVVPIVVIILKKRGAFPRCSSASSSVI